MHMKHAHHCIIVLAALLVLAAFDTGCNHDAPPLSEAFNHATYYTGGSDTAKTRKAELVADLKGAQDSIDIAVSHLTDTDVAQALIDAKNNGVDVRVISDWDSWTSADKAEAGLKMLEDHDVKPVYGDAALSYLPDPSLPSVLANCQVNDAAQYEICSSGQSGEQGQMVRPGNYNLMSHNFAIIDHHRVWNFPALDGTKRDWLGWRIDSELLAEDFGHEFQQMYGGVFATTLDVYNGPLKSSNDYNVRYYSDQGEMKVWFNPQERLIKTVIDEVYKAHASVWVMTDDLVNPNLLDALEYKKNNGFDVRIMVNSDTQATGSSKDRLDALGARHAPAGYDHLPTFIVIDQKPDRNGVKRPRRVIKLSHPLIRARPFETHFDANADKVFVYPADLFVDGNLWMLQESGSTTHKDGTVDQYTQHWLKMWNAAQ